MSLDTVLKRLSARRASSSKLAETVVKNERRCTSLPTTAKMKRYIKAADVGQDQPPRGRYVHSKRRSKDTVKAINEHAVSPRRYAWLVDRENRYLLVQLMMLERGSFQVIGRFVR